jgi:hypothetical protein
MTTKQTQETIELARATQLDVIKARKAAGKEASPSKGIVHALIIHAVVEEITSAMVQQEGETDADYALREKLTMLTALMEVENGSANRQSADVVAVLGKPSEKLGKAAALAAEFA